MRTISLKLPDEVDAKLTVRAKRTGKSKSQVTREALTAFLEDGRKKSAVSCLDLARDLAGSLKGGPPDLSSNKKYMRGYGK